MRIDRFREVSVRFPINNGLWDAEHGTSSRDEWRVAPLNPSTNLKILFVDDNPNVRSFVGPAIADAGYRYLEASDGLTALALVEEEQPDLDTEPSW